MERIPVIKTSDLSIGYILKGGQKKRVIINVLALTMYYGMSSRIKWSGKVYLIEDIMWFSTSSGRRNRANGEAAEFLFTR